MVFSLRSAVISAALLVLSLAVPFCAQSQTTTRLSLGIGGVEANKPSTAPRISADGSSVVYRSQASNLVPNDTNNAEDLFITRIGTGTTQRVNVATDGSQVTGFILDFSVSADGRYVAYGTIATGLDPADTNNFYDIYLRDTVANTTTLITKGIAGAQTNGSSRTPSISANGRYIAFESLATNLIAGDTNGVRDVFFYDTQLHAIARLSTDTGGAQSNGQSYGAVISGDGTAVAFYSTATNLVTGDTNAVGDVFVRNLFTGTTTRVSVATDGTQGNSSSGADDIAISYDGKLIAFDSVASNLVAGDTNGSLDVFIRDITLPAVPTTTRVSVNSAGIQGNGSSYLDSITPDGRFVVFDSDSTNLVGDDTNLLFDVFVRDRTLSTTLRVSLNGDGTQGNDESSLADISADGNIVVFASFATNLAPNDTNGFSDIFLRTPLRDTSTVSGTLTLEGIVPTAPNQTLTFTFHNGLVQYVRTVLISPSGAFSITGLPRANYTLLITGSSYLAKKIVFDSSAGDITLPSPILMRTGDANRDNVVDIADLLLLINAYNQISPAVGYTVAADFTLDGTNDISDLLLLIGNYNQMGDTLP